MNVIDFIRGTFLDTGKVEFDFVIQLDASTEDAKQPEYRLRLCRKDKRWDSTVLGMFASMVPCECLMFLCSKAITWRRGVSETPILKVILLDASRVRQADATNCEQNTLTRHIFSYLHTCLTVSHVTLVQGVVRIMSSMFHAFGCVFDHFSSHSSQSLPCSTSFF